MIFTEGNYAKCMNKNCSIEHKGELLYSICRDCRNKIPYWIKEGLNEIFAKWYFELLYLASIDNQIKPIAQEILDKINFENQKVEKCEKDFRDSVNNIPIFLEKIQDEFNKLIELYQEDGIETARKNYDY